MAFTLALHLALRLTIAAVTWDFPMDLTMISWRRRWRKSTSASDRTRGRPCFFRGTCLTKARVNVDLSRPSKSAISAGFFLSSKYYFLARHSSSEESCVHPASGMIPADWGR